MMKYICYNNLLNEQILNYSIWNIQKAIGHLKITGNFCDFFKAPPLGVPGTKLIYYNIATKRAIIIFYNPAHLSILYQIAEANSVYYYEGQLQ